MSLIWDKCIMIVATWRYMYKLLILVLWKHTLYLLVVLLSRWLILELLNVNIEFLDIDDLFIRVVTFFYFWGTVVCSCKICLLVLHINIYCRLLSLTIWLRSVIVISSLIEVVILICYLLLMHLLLLLVEVGVSIIKSSTLSSVVFAIAILWSS